MNQPNDFRPGGTPPIDATPLGRPAQAPVYEPPVPLDTGPNKVLIGIVSVSVLLVGFGIFRMVFAKPEPPKPKVQVQSIWSEQQAMMREAMTMAREAQAMQRERMELMRADSMGDYGGYGLMDESTEPSDRDW